MNCKNFIDKYCDFYCKLSKLLFPSQADPENEIDSTANYTHAVSCKYYNPEHLIFPDDPLTHYSCFTLMFALLTKTCLHNMKCCKYFLICQKLLVFLKLKLKLQQCSVLPSTRIKILLAALTSKYVNPIRS